MQRIASTRQAGFTMIELVMVIVIIGILAAFAVPRMTGLAGSARASAITSLEATLISGTEMIHAQALAEGKANAASGQSVTMEDGTTTVALAYGYPTVADIDKLIDISDDLAESAANSGIFQHQGAATKASCQIAYAAAAAAGSKPTITVTTTNCN